MGKGSLAKIAAALAIISMYIFLLGFTGRIDSLENSIPVSERTPEETDAKTAPPELPGSPDDTTKSPVPVTTTTAADEKRVVYTYSTTLNVVNARKPKLADYTATQPIMIIPETSSATKATEADVVLDASSFETTPAATTAPPPTEEPISSVSASEITTTPADISPETTVSTTTAASEEATTTTLPPPEETEEEKAATTPVIEDDINEVPDLTDDEELPPPPAAANEQISVYAGGKVVTGDALSIVSQAVMAEVGDSFNSEAIKAQAIATYTYFKYYNNNNQNAYAVLKTPSDNVVRCVSDVIGKAIYYNGSLIQAVYTASSAGSTASSVNVWGVDYPYLRSRRNDFDMLYDVNYGRQVTFTADQIRTLVLDNTGITLGSDPSTWFEIVSYVDDVYVGKMKIGGLESFSKGGKTVNITGRVFRETVMDWKIYSASFKIDYDPFTTNFTITTYGHGHGVGLSQYGANILATHYGYNYDQILKYYYQGTEIF